MATSSVSSAAAEDLQQVVEHDGRLYTAFKEGLATILVPQPAEEASSKKGTSSSGDPPDGQQVFYNPIQQFNRDLTALVIKAYGREVLERRKAALETRLDKLAVKKRKRTEDAVGESSSAKVAKQGDGAIDEEMGQFTEKPVESENPRPAAGDGSNGEGHPSGADGSNGDTSSAQVTQPMVQKDSKNDAEEGGVGEQSQKTSFIILDALSATGLRALRYGHEIPFATSITAVDLSKSAVDSIRTNISFNGMAHKVQVVQDDALAHMYSVVSRELRAGDVHPWRHKSAKYDVIDLDPYGTAATFFDAAVQAVRNDGGLLCVTCTDTGVWASNGYPEKAFSLYGGVPIKGAHSHEGGLRLILHALATSAARYGLAIEPLLSLSIDYYGRLFVRVRRSPAAVKFHASKTMVVYNCDAGCGAWTVQPLLKSRPMPNSKGSGIFYKHGFAAAPTAHRYCEHCSSTAHVAGPMYAGRLHSPKFIQRVLDELSTASPETYKTVVRIEGMLTTALEELTGLEMDEKDHAPDSSKGTATVPTSMEAEAATVDPYPFFFIPSQLASVLHCTTPGETAIRGALLHLGYRVTRSHCKRGSMKTNAPWSVIWRVMREWVRQRSPVKEEHIRVGMPAYKLLGLGQRTQEARANPDQDGAVEEAPVVFDEKYGKYPETNLVRYQLNPRENWGPMAKAKGR